MANRCTCGGQNSPHYPCDTCEARARIRERLMADAAELAALNGHFPGETYLALDALSAQAFVSGDWSAYNAALTDAMQNALDNRVTEELRREDRDAGLIVSTLRAAA